MARRADRSIRVTGWLPRPGSVIPNERDVLSGLPVQFDHTDKSRQTRHPDAEEFANTGGHLPTAPRPALRQVVRSAATGSGARVTPAVAVGVVVAVVAVIAGASFLISRVSSTTAARQPAAPTEFAPISASGSTAQSSVTSAALTPATIGGVAPSGAPVPPPGRSATRPSTSTVAGTPSSRSGSGGSATATSSVVAATTPKTAPLLPATAIGLDGTYRLSWRVTAELIVPGDVSRLGKTGTMTFVATRDCAAAGCRTTVVGDIFPAPPGDAAAWSRRSRTETIACRAVGTNELTGGSWTNRVENTSGMTAHQGTVVTAGTITQKRLQGRLCPGQTSPPLSTTVEMTFTRTGP